MTIEQAVARAPATLPDLLAASCAWGQLKKDGPYHALDPHWSDESRWASRCNTTWYRPESLLVSLAQEPTSDRCTRESCLRAYDDWRHARESIQAWPSC